MHERVENPWTVETLAAADGAALDGLGLAEQEAYWVRAKAEESPDD